jgi:cytochrome c-type biogenesis protein CcmE
VTGGGPALDATAAETAQKAQTAPTAAAQTATAQAAPADPARVAAGPPRPRRPAPGSVKARRTRRRLAVCGLVLLAAVGFLLYKGLTSAFVYFRTASQALADRASLGNATFQIEGTVVPCSVRKLGGGSYAFAITSGATRVAVRDSGDPPSLFHANVPVVLQGHFVAGSNVFASDQVLVKHSNQYVAAHPGRLAHGTLPATCAAGPA